MNEVGALGGTSVTGLIGRASGSLVVTVRVRLTGLRGHQGQLQGRKVRVVMSDQSVRQKARRTAREAQRTVRLERVAREKRLDAWAVDVTVALAQRDAWVAECEQRAGQGLAAMTGTGGLSVRDAAQRCVPDLTAREVSRLRRLCPEPVPDQAENDAVGDVPDDPARPAAEDGVVEGQDAADSTRGQPDRSDQAGL